MNDNKVQRIQSALVETGWIELPDFLTSGQLQELRQLAQQQLQQGNFRQADIGANHQRASNPMIRGDHICWLESCESMAGVSGTYTELCRFLDALRLHLNQTLYLGLFESELHLAFYPPGGRYQKHIDNFHGRSPRVITFILYLNEYWLHKQGGQLRLYTAKEREDDDQAAAKQISEPFVDIDPQGGTLVLFLSERFYHEVLPATRDRLSLTGWLRRREV